MKTESVKNRIVCSNLYQTYTSGTQKIHNTFKQAWKEYIDDPQVKGIYRSPFDK